MIFDNRDPLEVPISAWVEYGLKDGLHLPESVLQELSEIAARAVWRGKALGYLNHRPRTKAEVVRYLIGKGAFPEVAQQVVRSLEADGYLSDKQYAAQFVQTYAAKSSRREMAWKLSQRGVSTSATEKAFNDKEIYEGELAAAVKTAEKTLRAVKAGDPQAIRQKVWNRLLRKGFSIETARTALNLVRSEMQSIAQSEFLDNDWE